MRKAKKINPITDMRAIPQTEWKHYFNVTHQADSLVPFNISHHREEANGNLSTTITSYTHSELVDLEFNIKLALERWH